MPPKKEARIDEEMQPSAFDEPTELDEPIQAPIVTPTKKKTYHFPDIDGGGKAVAIEATSIDEAQELYCKEKGTA